MEEENKEGEQRRRTKKENKEGEQRRRTKKEKKPQPSRFVNHNVFSFLNENKKIKNE